MCLSILHLFFKLFLIFYFFSNASAIGAKQAINEWGRDMKTVSVSWTDRVDCPSGIVGRGPWKLLVTSGLEASMNGDR